MSKDKSRKLRAQTFNPLLSALIESDKDNLFQKILSQHFIRQLCSICYYFWTVVNIHNELGQLVQLVSQERRVGQAYRTFNLIIGNSGSFKGQPIYTKIPPPNDKHYILMKSIKIGDTIFDSDGNPTKVIRVFQQGEMDICRIMFSEHRFAYCDKNYLWEVYYKSHGKLRYNIMNILDIQKNYVKISNHNIRPYNFKLSNY